jgi:Transport and Golgi organisation 2
MCTVLLRYAPRARWPVLVAAVRDEFVERAWDPPAAHWGGDLLGGRDRVAGGTWLAVAPQRPALAAVLNGVRLPPPPGGARPSRGRLPLDALRGTGPPDPLAGYAGYDGFHLVRADPAGVQVLSWDGRRAVRRSLEPGDHVIVNSGPDTAGDPVVQRLGPLLRATPSPDPAGPTNTAQAWGGWLSLLTAAGHDPAAPGALLVRREYAGRWYGSTSISLVALAPGALRYDFTGSPFRPDGWRPVRQTE